MSALAYAPVDIGEGMTPIQAARLMAIRLKREAKEFVADEEAAKVRRTIFFLAFLPLCFFCLYR